MKKIMAFIITLIGVSSVWADSLVVTETSVTDNFDRSVGYNSGGTLGTDVWTNGNPAAAVQWGTVDNQVSANLGSGAGLLVNKALPTLVENGTNFTLSLDINALSDNRWSGVIFNYTDENNYYYLRFKSGTTTWLFYAFKDGVADKIGATGVASGTFASNTFYTVEVTSTDLYSFDITVKETSSGTVLVSESRAGEVAGEQLAGGYGGLIQSTAGNDLIRYDNFSLELIPPPLVVTDTKVTDNFNRTAGYSSLGTIGTTVWTNGFAGSVQWGITDNEVSANLGTGAVGILVNTALGTTNENGWGFTLSADVKALSDSRWAGVIFNYTDENNYYYFRYKSGTDIWLLQAIKGGVLSRLGATGAASATFASNTYYTVTVTSTNLYSFDVIIKETSSGTVLVSDSRVAEIPEEELSGGYGGLSQGTLGSDLVRFDNFSLEIFSTASPAPSSASLSVNFDGSNNMVIASYDLTSSASNVLQMASTLVPPDWTDVEAVSGVQSNEWTVPMTNSIGFFRVISY